MSVRSHPEDEYEDHLGMAIRAVQMPTLITDPRQPDNPIVFANDAFEGLTGYKREEILGRNCRFLQGPDTDRQTVERISTAIKTESHIQADILNYRKDGSSFWNALFINPVRGKDGIVRLFFASQFDVTSRVEAQRLVVNQKLQLHEQIKQNAIALDQLKQAKAVAEESVRQQAAFVANMSHELRTPLTGILGIHDVLHADVTLAPKHRRYLTMAQNAGRSLLAIVDDVLDFSKIEAGELSIHPSIFDLNQIIDSCINLYKELAFAKSLRLIKNCSLDTCLLVGDEGRIKQIINNLLSNAIKFTAKGTVSLIASYDADFSRLRVEVKDTGTGISKENIPRLYKRFSQADTSITRRFGGTGLGLAICHRLTELMGGQIGVESKPKRGSSFWVEIPAGRASKTNGLKPEAIIKVKPKRVLLAEDNEVNQEIIKLMLETFGHHITLVGDGAAAASAASAMPPFDLILMDVQMPVMDGLSAARAIRLKEQKEGRKLTPIIGLSANAMLEDVERCLSVGMDAHVAKPIEWPKLFAAMKHAESLNSAASGTPKSVSH